MDEFGEYMYGVLNHDQAVEFQKLIGENMMKKPCGGLHMCQEGHAEVRWWVTANPVTQECPVCKYRRYYRNCLESVDQLLAGTHPLQHPNDPHWGVH